MGRVHPSPPPPGSYLPTLRARPIATSSRIARASAGVFHTWCNGGVEKEAVAACGATCVVQAGGRGASARPGGSARSFGVGSSSRDQLWLSLACGKQILQRPGGKRGRGRVHVTRRAHRLVAWPCATAPEPLTHAVLARLPRLALALALVGVATIPRGTASVVSLALFLEQLSLRRLLCLALLLGRALLGLDSVVQLALRGLGGGQLVCVESGRERSVSRTGARCPPAASPRRALAAAPFSATPQARHPAPHRRAHAGAPQALRLAAGLRPRGLRVTRPHARSPLCGLVVVAWSSPLNSARTSEAAIAGALGVGADQRCRGLARAAGVADKGCCGVGA